jgi:esterase/lipase superfamily enzyme
MFAMHRAYHRWHSPSLGRDMELLAFGHAGARVLAFPTSNRRFFEWEDYGLVAILAEHLERGWLQLFCVDGIDRETWYAWDRHPADRARRQVQYDSYLLHEVLPFLGSQNANPFLIVTGASFGAYQAVNFAFRHPERVGRVLGMSGLYDLARFRDGYYDDNIYYNNPCDFLAGEPEGPRLDALRRMDIILAVGRDDPLRPGNEQLSGLLWAKNVWHALRVWDGFAHDWPAWRRMLPLYIGGHD